LNGYFLANTIRTVASSSTYLKHWCRVERTIQLAWFKVVLSTSCMMCQHQWRNMSLLISVLRFNNGIESFRVDDYSLYKIVYHSSRCRQPMKRYPKEIEESFGNNAECGP